MHSIRCGVIRGEAEELRVTPMRGECGRSKYAQRVREARKRAANDGISRHVLVVGEPGTMKLDTAKLVHFSSVRRSLASNTLDCGRFFRSFPKKLLEKGPNEDSSAKTALDDFVQTEVRAVDALK